MRTQYRIAAFVFALVLVFSLHNNVMAVPFANGSFETPVGGGQAGVGTGFLTGSDG